MSVWLSNRASANRLSLQLAHERDLKSQEARRVRVEELYLLASAWIIAVLTYSLPYLRVMKGDLSYNQALDITNSTGAGSGVDFKRLEMLIHIYFSELRGTFAALLEVRDRTNSILSAHRENYRQGEINGTQFVAPLLAAQAAFESVGESFKSAVIAREREI